MADDKYKPARAARVKQGYPVNNSSMVIEGEPHSKMWDAAQKSPVISSDIEDKRENTAAETIGRMQSPIRLNK